MIYTDANGRPIVKPVRGDYQTDSDYVRAFHSYKDKIAAAANESFDTSFRSEMKKKPAKKARSKHRSKKVTALTVWKDPDTLPPPSNPLVRLARAAYAREVAVKVLSTRLLPSRAATGENMATRKQIAAAKRNIKKAQAARKKKTHKKTGKRRAHKSCSVGGAKFHRSGKTITIHL